MPNRPSIRILSDQVANKIAAGEVVERPASVVKELMENAIDAGATHIHVTVVGGGRQSIVVADNGAGMSRDDALMCVERHATSKIRDIGDIEKINTLGFRGEALAAIASVSRFSIVTRSDTADSGTEVTISGGTLQSVEEIGAPQGTRVAVRNLFFNVPARRKFLRAEGTEFSHIRQLFLLQALAHPDLSLRLTSDDRDVYDLPAGATLSERIRETFSADLAQSLMPIDHRDADAHVSGWAGTPTASRADRSEQYVFVNGRPASAPLIAHALREAYQSLIPKGRHPVVFLLLRIDPAQVDVNVHPAKKEVRFRRPTQVRDAIIHALRSALGNGARSQIDGDAGLDSADTSEPPPRTPLIHIRDMPVLEPFRYPTLPMVAPRTDTASADADLDPDDAERRSESPWAWCRILGQVGGLYVVMESDEGLVLMDPHAAHERVLFERFLGEAASDRVHSQGLLVPECVDLTPNEARCVRQCTDVLLQMGFGISDFGGDSFLVDALPAVLGEVGAVSVLGPIAQELEQSGARDGTLRVVRERIARAACQAAVRANDTLQLKEIERLVVDLAQAEMPYTCPHGRPTIVFMGTRELDRKFGRAR